MPVVAVAVVGVGVGVGVVVVVAVVVVCASAAFEAGERRYHAPAKIKASVCLSCKCLLRLANLSRLHTKLTWPAACGR